MKKINIYVAISIVLIVFAFALAVPSIYELSGKVFESTNRICRESDGGLNKYEKGTIFYSYRGNEKEYTDYCYEEKTLGKYKRLSEYYCTVYDRIRTKRYICENGCKDGACTQAASNVSCVDSDTGLRYDVKGRVCVEEKCEDDLCLDKIYLSERYCNNLGQVKTDIHKCENKCEYGKCV